MGKFIHSELSAVAKVSLSYLSSRSEGSGFWHHQTFVAWNLSFAAGKLCDPEAGCLTSLNLGRDIRKACTDVQPQVARERWASVEP